MSFSDRVIFVDECNDLCYNLLAGSPLHIVCGADMIDFIQKYRDMPYEDRLVVRAFLGLCWSAVLTCGKFFIGLFTDVNLCVIAVYTCAILLAKLQCVRGVKGSSPKRRNVLAAVFLFLASVVYSGFMGSMAFKSRSHGDYGVMYAIFLAVIAFCELGFAMRGIIRTQDKGYQYFEIKIIDFCIGLIALLTAQIAILDCTTAHNVDAYNSFAGMGVGIFIAVCALYVLFAPKIALAGRERQTFLLKEAQKNGLVDMQQDAAKIVLCRSAVYGSYVYSASIRGPFVDGQIVRTSTLWERMPLAAKIVCAILSEILIFVWLFFRAVFFFRTFDLPGRLKRRMAANGFESVKTDTPKD